ncbi:MAG: PAS domain S-box protein [bacterium]
MKKESQTKNTILRQKAEELMSKKTSKLLPNLSDEETQKLIYELEVHQIELEQQTEELKLAKEETQIAVDKYKELFDFAPSGYITFSRDGLIIEINLRGSLMIGIERSRLIKRHLVDFVSHDTQQIFNLFIENVFHSRTIVVCDVTLINDDSLLMYVHLSAIVTDNIEQCNITMIDITERKIAEEKVKESYALQRIAEKKTHLGGWNVILEENRSYWSDEVAAIHGMPAGYSPLVEDAINFYAPEWRDRITQAFTDCSEKGIPYDVELQIITSTGKRVWVQTIGEAVRNEKGEIFKVQGAFQDINERKKAEEKLRESEEKYGSLFNKMLEGFALHEIILDDEGNPIDYRFLEMNRAFEKMTNLKAEEVVGKTVLEILPNTEKYWIENYGRVAMTGEPLSFENYSGELDRYFRVLAFSNAKGQFATVFEDITERKKTENELFESEQKFRNFFDNSVVGKSITGLDGTLSTNKAFRDILGYSEEDLTAIKWLELTHPADIEKNELIINSILAGEKPSMRWEKRYIHKNGNIVWVDLSTFLQRNSKGKPQYFITTIQDITERKKAEEALMQIERTKTELLEKLNDAQHMAMIGSWEWNLQTNQVWWSDETYRIFGVTPADFVPGFEENGQFIHPDDLNSYRKTFEQSFKSGEPLDYQYRLVTRNGEFKSCHAKGKIIYDDSGKQISFIGTIMDITEQKQAETALRESEERYRSLLTHLEAGVVVHRPDTSIFMNNHRASVLLGLSEDQMKGKLAIDPQWKFIHLDKSQLMLEEYPVNRIKDTKKPINNLTLGVIRNSVNDVVWLLVNGFPFLNTNGEIREILVSFIDITERIKAEQEILLLNSELEHRVIQRTEQLEIANKELEAFTYSVSHDLRAPLRHINGYVDLLLRRYHEALPEKGQHYLDTIASSANQMGTLIDDLLDFSKTGRQELHHTELNMNTVLEEALELIKTSIKNRNIEWVIADLPSVIGDHPMMRLVWTNLLSNAVKFTRPREKAVIEINSYIENNEIVFLVQDNGVGFDMQYSNKLFGVFQRLHPVEDFEGTGIGLANVRRIIIKHDGRTWADSKLGKGATFYFTIPKNKE